MKRLGARLFRCDRGAAVVELGLLAPLMCTLLLGVLHVGISMHHYNALRGIAADVARYAVVEYQSAEGNNPPTNSQIEDIARGIATSPLYGLQADNLQVTIADAGVQRVADAKELTLTVTYQMDSLMGIVGVDDFEMEIERPIFVLDD